MNKSIIYTMNINTQITLKEDLPLSNFYTNLQIELRLILSRK